MKRIFSLLLLVPALTGWNGLTPTASAQSAALETTARREELEDNVKRLTAAVERLDANQAAQQQRLEALEKGLQNLSEALSKANASTATQDSLRRLNEHIQKVDEARVSENRKIQETLNELNRVVVAAASAPPPRAPTVAPPPRAPNANNATEEGFEYIVQNGDSLSKIVQDYRTQGIKVTQKMVMDANPTVKWERLRVHQKIFIPKPKN